jgi:hypothetical protein
LITRYRRHRENGSRTTDLIVLNMERSEPLSLTHYSGIVGDVETGDLPTAVGALVREVVPPTWSGIPSGMVRDPVSLGPGSRTPVVDLGEDNGGNPSTPTIPTAQTLLVVEDETSVKIPCWDLPPTDDVWSPSYLNLDPSFVEIAEEERVVWTEPPPERLVLDFWRDLHWHLDAELTPTKKDAIATALKHYPVRVICRAIAAGLTDRWIQDPEHGGPHDKLETLIAITSKRDNVDRLSHQVTDDELSDHVLNAQDNRMMTAHWRAENWSKIDYHWRLKHKKRLRREGMARYQRYMAWEAQRDAAQAAAKANGRAPAPAAA